MCSLSLITENWNGLCSPRSEATGRLEDVWDGSALRPLCNPGRFFADSHNLALTVSTDGVALYKSSPLSIWPVFLVILNLPAKIRMNADNVILCGVWVGPRKPLMKLLLNPLCLYLQQLSLLGVRITTSTGNFVFRAKLVMGVFAKAAVLCAKQYNGEFGCSVCLHPGKRLSNNARVYLPDTTYPNRTHDQVIAEGKKAEECNSCENGIFGLSPFSSSLDLVNSVPVDYMHCVLEGVTRWLTRAWFDSKFHDSPFYIGRSVKDIDLQLLNQCPPSEFTRPPRSIKNIFHIGKHLNCVTGYCIILYHFF